MLPKRHCAKTILGVSIAIALGGCSLAPTYRAPVIAIKTDEWQDNMWKVAQPTDDYPREAWWQIYSDPILNDLESKIEQGNPTLAVALARFDQANAYKRQLQSGLFPSVDGGVSITNNRQSDNRPLRGSNQPNLYRANMVGLSANYELDVWGKVRNLVEAGTADAQASAADVETIKLSLHAQLADDYLSLRGIDTKLKLLHTTVNAYQQALELTQRRHAGGVASGLDVARAETQISTLKAQLADITSKRATLEHAIASLIGQPAMNFNLDIADHPLLTPEIPVDLPSTLLQRRPDISAAERRTAAANATIGVARAAYFPDFSLGTAFGYQNTTVGPLLSAPNSFWLLGPSAIFNLFDAGKREAEVAQAKAALEIAGSQYRATVLTAFQQVEDALSALKYTKEGEIEQTAAVKSAQTTLSLSLNRYREGAVNYLDVVTAQASALSAESNLLDLHTQQLRSSVELIRALGGGWNANQLQVKSNTTMPQE